MAFRFSLLYLAVPLLNEACLRLTLKFFTYNLHKTNIKLYLWTVCLKRVSNDRENN